MILTSAVGLVIAACGGDADTAATDTTKTSTETQSTDSPVTTTTVIEAAATTTPAVVTTTTEGGVQLVDLSERQQEFLDFLCFAAVVEGDYVGDYQGMALQIQSGEIGVPALEAIVNEFGIDDETAFLEEVAPVCEEIGWTP